MKTSTLLCGLCLLPLLAVAHVAEAQTPSPYRPPAAPAISTQSSASASPAGGQCTGAPAGATLVSQGKGSVPAPRGGQPAYAQVALNLANYAVGGLLTIQITAGNGGAATFELFPGNTTFGSNGAPNTQPIVAQANVAAGSCVVLTLNFSQAGSFILVATGSSGMNGSNTFQYMAYVQPSFAGVFHAAPSNGTGVAPAVSAARPASPAPVAQPSSPVQPATTQGTPSQGSSMFNGVFSPSPATQAGSSQPASPAQPVAAIGVQPAPAAVNQVQSAAQAQAPDSPSSSSPDPSQPSSSSAANTPLMIQAVTIQNSPGVPDTGGHCIICGLVTGNLTAVEPNLVICVTPSGGTDAARACTGVCNPGHDCQAPLNREVTLLPSNHSVHVEILDNDKQGKVTPLAAFDESDATQCTTAQPCSQTVPDPTSPDANGTQLSISFGFGEGCNTSANLWNQGPILLASTMFPAGSLPAQVNRSSTEGCAREDFTFTSYSGLINSQQLYEAFMSLYGGSNLFKTLMGQVRARHKTVNVVIAGDGQSESQQKYVSDQGKRAYLAFKANNPVAARIAPLPDPTMFAYTEPSARDGEFDVVISDAFLAYGYYPAWTPTPRAFLHTTITELPIQLTLAYELGSNVLGLAADPNFREDAYQTFTNCIMEQAFSKFGFVANGSNANPTTGQQDPKIYTAYATSSIVVPKNAKTVVHPIVNGVPGNYFPVGRTPDPSQVDTYEFNSKKPGKKLGDLAFAIAANEVVATKGVQQEVEVINEVGPQQCDVSDPLLAQIDTSGDKQSQKSGIIKVNQDFSSTPNSSDVNQQNQQQNNPQGDSDSCNVFNYFCGNGSSK